MTYSFAVMTFSNGTKAPLSHPDDDSEEFVEDWKYHDGEILFDCDGAVEPDFITDAAQIDTEIGRASHNFCHHGES
jgi:hypothetical protein